MIVSHIGFPPFNLKFAIINLQFAMTLPSYNLTPLPSRIASALSLNLQRAKELFPWRRRRLAVWT